MLTNAGKDMVASAIGDRSGSRAAVADYLALTANTTTPAATDTTLTGEIATAGGALIGGTATYTLTKTFTANGSDALPVTVAKIGVFNASSAGAMVWETLLSATSTLSASGDALTITSTITLS
jgi:uncharacterized membrane-anchored protein